MNYTHTHTNIWGCLSNLKHALKQQLKFSVMWTYQKTGSGSKECIYIYNI